MGVQASATKFYWHQLAVIAVYLEGGHELALPVDFHRDATVVPNFALIPARKTDTLLAGAATCAKFRKEMQCRCE